jgi:hypothetical protein
MVAEVLGNVIVVPSVPARVRVFDTDNVLALVTVKAPVLEVIVKPLIEVAVAAPSTGVVNVIPAKVRAPDERFNATEVVPIKVLLVIAESVNAIVLRVVDGLK